MRGTGRWTWALLALLGGMVLAISEAADRPGTRSAPAAKSNVTPADATENDWDTPKTPVTVDYVGELKTLREQLSTAKDGPEARALALRGILLATVVGDAKGLQQLRGEMLEKYPTSLEAEYIIRTLADAKAARDFLDGWLLQQPTAIASYRHRLPVVQRVWSRFPKDLLGDHGFALRFVRFGMVTGDQKIQSAGMAVLQGESARVARTALDELTTPVQRFLELQALVTHRDYSGLLNDLQGFQDFLYEQLSDSERERFDVRHAVARNRLAQGKLAEALPLLEQLVSIDGDPQLQLQYGYCLARLRRDDEAIAVLSQIPEQSPWYASATALRRALPTVDAAMAQAGVTLYRLFHAYDDTKVEVLEVRFRTKKEGLIPSYLTAGLDLKQNIAQFAWERDQRLQVAVRMRDLETSFYVQTDPVIYRLMNLALLPMPRVKEARIDDNGEFRGEVNFQSGATAAEAFQSFRDLVKENGTLGMPGLTKYLATLPRSGVFCLPQVETEGTLTLPFVALGIDTPQVRESELRFDPTGRCSGAKVSFGELQLEIEQVALGASHEVSLTPLAWPEVPVQQLTNNDIGLMFRICGTVFDFVKREFMNSSPAKK